MIRISAILAAAALALLATATLAPTAAADNCDIFINPEDCQNTGWTIGTIATLTGGVAVATVALTSMRTRRPRDHPPPPSWTPSPPWTPPPPPWPGRQSSGRDDSIEGVRVWPVLDPPTVAVDQRGGPTRAHTVRLELNRDQGTQTVREAHRGPH